MARSFLIFAALSGAAVPAVAGVLDKETDRQAQNWDVLFSQYPPRALAAGEEGAVGFKVTLDKDGYGTTCEVTQSSGYRSLDQETCRLIMNNGVFKGIQGDRGRKTNSVHEGVVNWMLPLKPANGASPTPAATATGDLPDRVVCKRTLKTGSLVSRDRVCHTTAEWRRLNERIKEEWGELQGTKGSTYGN